MVPQSCRMVDAIKAAVEAIVGAGEVVVDEV